MGEDFRRGVCQICKGSDAEEDETVHKSSQIHVFNFHLLVWKKYRKCIVKNRDGIEVDIKPVSKMEVECKFNSKRGKYTVFLNSHDFKLHGNTIDFEARITNISNKNIVLYSGLLLHPYPLFKLIDENLNQGKQLELEPKAWYTVIIRYTNSHVTPGSIKIPVSFNFVTTTKTIDKVTKTSQYYFTIARSLVLVFDHQKEDVGNDKPSPFTKQQWDSSVKIDTPISLRHPETYSMPKGEKRLIYAALQDFTSMTPEERHILHSVINVKMAPGHVTATNYKDYFHYLLWLDEAAQELGLRQYNMENVYIKVLNKDEWAELEVPGLAEKRPSVVVGDRILVRLHDDHHAYTGLIKHVQDSTVTIDKLDKTFLNYLSRNPTELDVAFVQSRLVYQRMHEGIDEVCKKNVVKYLFPDGSDINNGGRNLVNIQDNELINPRLADNYEQKCAVINILNHSSLRAPYVVYGPPGTGKTATIVEAILQIKRRSKKRILVCAPANSTCDMIALKLSEFCSAEELIRINSENRDMSTVTEKLQKYCNEVGFKVSGEDLMGKRIVVSTLVLIGKYMHKYRPDYVFIDEAGQALEPEADIAFGLSRNAQIILAGDPKQLGPICTSKVAAKLGLEVSLLKRLLETVSLYQQRHPNYITMLKFTYRSHKEILQIPNELFYNNELITMNNQVIFDEIANINIHPLIFKPYKMNSQKNGSPVEFCCVMGKETREGRSPSYYNLAEVKQVCWYIKTMLKLDLAENNVQPGEIGVITPYIRQVYRIREMLKNNGIEGVEVGTTETFQGREKRVILISTVRAQHNLLLYDRKYNLGFVRQSNRFNVALTRAQAKLIVVGCPAVLGTDDKWLMYIEKCEANNSYFGPLYQRRDQQLRTDIIQRMGHYKKDAAYKKSVS